MPLNQFKMFLNELARLVTKGRNLVDIPNTWTPLLLSSVRDAILYQEGLLRSETLRDRSDYEEHHLQLSQFLEYLKHEYKKIEAEVGLPLEKIL